MTSTEQAVPAFMESLRRMQEIEQGKLYRCAKCGQSKPERNPHPDTDALLCDSCFAEFSRNAYVQQCTDQLPPKYRNVVMLDITDRGNIADIKHNLRDLAGKYGRWVYLHGDVGNGKTSLLAAAFRGLARKGVKVRWFHALDLMTEIKRCYRADGSSWTDTDEIQNWAAIASNGVLFIDDLDKINPTDWAGEKIYQLINESYNHPSSRIWVTSNSPLDALTERFKRSGGTYGEAICSRIFERAVVMHNTSTDARLV